MSKKIGTHGGSFHCDEALACYMLRLTKEFSGAEIVRSRDPATLAECDVVVDVGAVFSVEEKKFDHHQRGFEEYFAEGFETKLSSAGLVYKYYGREVVGSVSGLEGDDLEIIYKKVYKNFIEGLDGIDNGVSQYPEGVEAKYKVSTDLSARVGKLNPRWNEEGVDLQERFSQASEMAGKELVAEIEFLTKGWLPARAIVADALANRFKEHASGEIIRLSACPWQSHLFDLEGEQGIEGLVKYCLYADQSGKWRIQAVPAEQGSFQSRKALPEPWRGVRDEELSDLIGIPGCIFTHASGFIGGNSTLEGIQAMASKALEYNGDEVRAKKMKI